MNFLIKQVGANIIALPLIVIAGFLSFKDNSCWVWFLLAGLFSAQYIKTDKREDEV